MTDKQNTGGSVWDWEKGALLCHLDQGAEGGKPQWSPEGDRIFVQAYGGPDLYDAGTGRRLWRASGARASSIQPGFRQLATAEPNGDVVLRDMATGAPTGLRLPHDQLVRSLAYSPDGTLLATGSNDQFARLWRVSDGTMIGSAMRHAGPILRIVFSPNGSMFATATKSGTVRLWDVASAQPLTVPWPHVGELCDLFFEHTGSRLVAAVYYGSVHLHELPPLPRHPPDWLPALAEAVARQRVDESGELSKTKLPELTPLRVLADAASGTEPYERWLKWFFADRATRTISAFSEKPMSAGIDGLLTGIESLDDLEEARRRRPLDPAVMKRLAEQYRLRKEPALSAHADFLDALAAWNVSSGAQKRIEAAGARMHARLFDDRGFLLRDAEASPRLLIRLRPITAAWSNPTTTPAATGIWSLCLRVCRSSEGSNSTSAGWW